MARLELSFLGRWQVALDGQAVMGFESGKVRALLTYLAVESGQPHYREALAGLLWPAVPDAVALASLRQALANLCKTICDPAATPPFLLITRATIQFNLASDHSLDMADFTTLLAACDRHRHRHVECCRACAERLQQATDFYHGDFLEGFFVSGSFEFEEWALIRRERLRHQALDALGHLAGCYERRAAFELAQGTLVRQLELESWHEEAHRRLMHVLARSSQRSAALAQYKTCRRLLAEELGLEPAAETVALYKQIKSGELEEESPGGVPPLLNWPHSATPVIGREAELAELAELIANPDCRLLTILSPGGMGKSRLALEVAAAEAWSFGDGAAFVPLAPLSSADYLAPTIARALGVALSSRGDPRQQLIHTLREREILIVLDNFEHLRDGTSLLSELLTQAPRVQLLVTSRERVDVEGEWLFELGGLSYPSRENAALDVKTYSAVQLFLHSARRAQSTFTMAEADWPAVGRICRMVGGMPLAIELAAAWVRVISCAEIAVELERGFSFLSTARRDVTERHRSLRAVFDHSWQLLTAEEQCAFRSLSVFAGSFEREAAKHVAGVTLPLLSALVDKTLVRRDHAGRYDMHELIAEYAREKLCESGDEKMVRGRHTAYMLQLAERAEPKMRGPQQIRWLKRLDTERNNLRAALDWILISGDDQQLETGLRIASALGGYWWMRSLGEGCDWLARLLHHPLAAKHTSARAKALAQAGDLAIEQEGDYGTARLMYEESLSISRELGDRPVAAASLLGLGAVARAGGDMAKAQALCEQALATWQELDEQWGIAWALHELGDVAYEQADLASARSFYGQSLVIRREVGDKSGVAWLFNELGEVARYEGHYERARALYEESLRLHREVGNKAGIIGVLTNMGYVALNLGDDELAKALFEESLSQNPGIKWLSVLCLTGLAGVAQQAGHSARLLGAAEPFCDIARLADRADHERIVAAVRAQLDETTFAVAWEAGRAMTLNEAVEFALQEERLKE